MSTVPIRSRRGLALAVGLALAALAMPGPAQAQNDETPFGGQPVVFRTIGAEAPTMHWDDSDNRPSHANRGAPGRGRGGRR